MACGGWGYGAAGAESGPAREQPYSAPATIGATNQQRQKYILRVMSIMYKESGKWKQFCDELGNGVTEPSKHDEAFLLTFLEAYDAGELLDPEPTTDQQPGNQSGRGGSSLSQSSSSDSRTWYSSKELKLFVGGLPREKVNEDDLREYFAQFGTVAKAELKYDTDWRPRGFGFVQFYDKSAYDAALNATSHELKGKRIQCTQVDGLGKKGGRRAADGYDGGATSTESSSRPTPATTALARPTLGAMPALGSLSALSALPAISALPAFGVLPAPTATVPAMGGADPAAMVAIMAQMAAQFGVYASK